MALHDYDDDHDHEVALHDDDVCVSAGYTSKREFCLYLCLNIYVSTPILKYHPKISLKVGPETIPGTTPKRELEDPMPVGQRPTCRCSP